MDWKERTVSMGNVDREEFESELGVVTVSENGVTVEFEDVEDWKKIRREVGDERILRQVYWEEVEEVESSVEHLYYPHIDIQVEGDGERRVYFTEDEVEELEACLKAVERFWNAFRERGPGSRDSYSYESGGEEEAGEEVELQEEEIEVEDVEEESGGEEDGKDVEDVVDEFMRE